MVHCKLTFFIVGRTFVEFKKTADLTCVSMLVNNEQVDNRT